MSISSLINVAAVGTFGVGVVGDLPRSIAVVRLGVLDGAIVAVVRWVGGREGREIRVVMGGCGKVWSGLGWGVGLGGGGFEVDDVAAVYVYMYACDNSSSRFRVLFHYVTIP